MSIDVIEILQKCREELQECALAPLNIEQYREDLSKECNVAVDPLKELKEAEERAIELEQKCDEVKDLPNKMAYSCVVKEIATTKNKIADLSHQINHAVRNHETVVDNKKRVNIEIDRLDDILRMTQIELYEYGDTPTLKAETEDFVPLQIAREQVYTKMKETLQALDNVRETLQREKLEHRDLVYDLKMEIKKTRADIEAMENGTYEPHVEFMTKLSEKRAAQESEMDKERSSIEGEIKELHSLMEKQTKVHNADMSALQSEKAELEQTIANTAKEIASLSKETEATLEWLEQEQAENNQVLQKLEQRLAEEEEEARLLGLDEEKRLQKIEAEKAREEIEYFAALWIQLRWKAYLKRKASKQSSKGKKGSKKGKKKKK